MCRVHQFGGRGSNAAWDRVGCFIVWVMATIGFYPHLFVDDLIHIGTRKQVCASQRCLDILVEMLGIYLRLPKRVLACTSAKYIGFIVDTVGCFLQLTVEFMAKIVASIDRLRWAHAKMQSVENLAVLLGLLARASMVVLTGPLHTFHLRALTRAAGKHVNVSAAAKVEVRWWRQLMAGGAWNGRKSFLPALADVPTDSIGESDACERAMGGCFVVGTNIYWFYHEFVSERTRLVEMCTKECLAAATLVYLYGRMFPGARFLMESDSKVTCSNWAKRSCRRGHALSSAMLAVDSATVLCDVSVCLRWIPGETNVRADPISRADWPRWSAAAHPFIPVQLDIPQEWIAQWL